MTDVILDISMSLDGCVTAPGVTAESLPWWGADGPSGAARVPVFVVTHRGDAPPAGGVYAFSDGVQRALVDARAAAGERGVCVMGGADIAQQFLEAAMIDEVSIHLVPVVFGGGTRLFGDSGLELENLEAIQTSAATTCGPA